LRLLLLDIETAPNVVHAWGLWNVNVGLSQLIEPGYVLCWSAKWVGEPKIFFSSIRGGAKKMLTEIHNLLSEADAVITWNGSQFDIPHLNREFLRYGFTPPEPYAQIDLLTVARKRFRFVSNKLENVCKELGVGEKIKNEGHSLWIGCMTGEPKSWANMKRYNINDTAILEAVYEKMLPWISSHPHVGLRDGKMTSCPNCGGTKIQSRGWAYTALGKYKRYQCRTCWTWSRDNTRVATAVYRPVSA